MAHENSTNHRLQKAGDGFPASDTSDASDPLQALANWTDPLSGGTLSIGTSRINALAADSTSLGLGGVSAPPELTARLSTARLARDAAAAAQVFQAAPSESPSVAAYPGDPGLDYAGAPFQSGFYTDAPATTEGYLERRQTFADGETTQTLYQLVEQGNGALVLLPIATSGQPSPLAGQAISTRFSNLLTPTAPQAVPSLPGQPYLGRQEETVAFGAPDGIDGINGGYGSPYFSEGYRQGGQADYLGPYGATYSPQGQGYAGPGYAGYPENNAEGAYPASGRIVYSAESTPAYGALGEPETSATGGLAYSEYDGFSSPPYPIGDAGHDAPTTAWQDDSGYGNDTTNNALPATPAPSLASQTPDGGTDYGTSPYLHPSVDWFSPTNSDGSAEASGDEARYSGISQELQQAIAGFISAGEILVKELMDHGPDALIALAAAVA